MLLKMAEKSMAMSVFPYKNGSDHSVWFLLSQVSGTLVRVFISLAWSRYVEKLY